MRVQLSTSLLSALFLCACSQTNLSQGVGATTGTIVPSGGGSTAQVEQKLPVCTRSYGKVALVENQQQAGDLLQMNLTSPLPVIRTMISQSGCFTIVDRGQALGAIEAEQKYSGKGGIGKLAGADFFITPQIVFKDGSQNSIGGALSKVAGVAGLGGGFGGIVGTVAGNMNVSTTEAQVALFLTETKSGIQKYSALGQARTSTLGLSADGPGALFGAGVGSYANSDVGKTTVAALLDAYIKLVDRMRSS